MKQSFCEVNQFTDVLANHIYSLNDDVFSNESCSTQFNHFLVGDVIGTVIPSLFDSSLIVFQT